MFSLESQLLRSIAHHLKTLARSDPTFAWRKRHGSAFTVAGDPDIHGVWRGVPFEVELKRSGQEPTPLQTVRLAEWSRAGAHTFVVHSLAELQHAIDTLRKVV